MHQFYIIIILNKNGCYIKIWSKKNKNGCNQETQNIIFIAERNWKELKKYMPSKKRKKSQGCMFLREYYHRSGNTISMLKAKKSSFFLLFTKENIRLGKKNRKEHFSEKDKKIRKKWAKVSNFKSKIKIKVIFKDILKNWIYFTYQNEHHYETWKFENNPFWRY